MATFTGLIERLEKALAPDRTLDKAIGETVGATPRHHTGWHLEYTDSIDAALTLVPKGWHWQVGNFEDRFLGQVYPAGPVDPIKYQAGRGRTAAIAICIAALKVGDA